MPRKKSVSDIYSQYRRILDENVRRSPDLSGETERARTDMALSAFKRYVGNIGKQKSMRRWDRDKKFSQRAYMGLAAG